MKLLFFGELAPRVVHGVSLANSLNVEVLSSEASVEVIEERTRISSIGKASIGKLIGILSSVFSILRKSYRNDYDAFYLVLSLSKLGACKTLLAVFSFSLFSKGQVVLHLHRGDFWQFWRKSWFHRVLICGCFFLSEKLIVLSEKQRYSMRNFSDRISICVVENSVMEEKTLDRFLPKFEFRGKFLFISNYMKEKGIYDLLCGFPRSNDCALDCHGSFANNEKELQSLESDNVRVYSRIDGAEKFKKLYEADALILPSWNEGQPTIILEAMMVGTPVLTTKVGLIEELLGEDYPFYFEERSPDALAECVVKFMEFQGKAELSAELQEKYFKLYGNERHKESLLSVFAR